MTTPTLTFFNNGGGARKTSLTWHLSWMFAERGLRVLAVDLDPTAGLTASFLDDTALNDVWNGGKRVGTMLDSIGPLLADQDLAPVTFREMNARLALVPGHLGLNVLQDALCRAWADSSADGNQFQAFQLLAAFWRSAQDAAERFGADLIVFDACSSLGALNRAALIASQYVVVPLGADLFSLQGLRNLGPMLREWRDGWALRRDRLPTPSFELPDGDIKSLGYVAMQQDVQLARPVQAYTRWLDQIPAEYRRSVLGMSDGHLAAQDMPGMESDPHCLAILKNYHSLMPLSQEARKPIFSLRPADGAIGAHADAVRDAWVDFDRLARRIAMQINPLWAERIS